MAQKEPPLSFDLKAFRVRAKRAAGLLGIELPTLSKKLFSNNALTLGKLMDEAVPDAEKTFPRLDTLLNADKRLKDIEDSLDDAVA